MARLYRPHIPLSVKVQVANRDLERLKPHAWGRKDRPLHEQLSITLEALAIAIGCTVKDLRLDHDPPLAARPRRRRGLGRKTYYEPDANDPDHLFYRPHGPEFEGSHLIKTNVRGDNGQYPDRVLIKRAKRRERGLKKKPKKKWASRPFPRGRSFGRSRP